eukprot:1411567-Amphidinium_carterae.1
MHPNCPNTSHKTRGNSVASEEWRFRGLWEFVGFKIWLVNHVDINDSVRSESEPGFMRFGCPMVSLAATF